MSKPEFMHTSLKILKQIFKIQAKSGKGGGWWKAQLSGGEGAAEVDSGATGQAGHPGQEQKTEEERWKLRWDLRRRPPWGAPSHLTIFKQMICLLLFC